MVVQANKLRDELLPEIEMSITPSKLSENVRVDLYKFSDEFIQFLFDNNLIGTDDIDGNIVDTVEMPLLKFTSFCGAIRDAYGKYKVSQNAHV